MTALIDFDSIIYNCVYRIVSFSQIREAIENYGKEDARQWLMQEVYNEGVNRCENELLKMQNYLSTIFFSEITSFELYITTCNKSFRKELSKDYKAKRVKNNYVWMIRDHYKFNDAFFSDTLEADDLIANRVNELGRDNCIVVSIDKDMRTIGGWLWSYYKINEVDTYGNLMLNEYGNKSRIYKYDSVEWITQDEANLFFWKQVLMGDSGDGVRGLKRVGVKTAEKILKDSVNHFITVAREYIKRGQKDDFWLNYKLLKLG